MYRREVLSFRADESAIDLTDRAVTGSEPSDNPPGSDFAINNPDRADTIGDLVANGSWAATDEEFWLAAKGLECILIDESEDIGVR